MKKVKGLLLGLCFCGAMFAFGGCGELNNPYLLEVSNTKTQFAIGEDFSFSENMKIDLVFENDQKMELETPANYTFLHDPIKKTFSGLHYTVDYSAFDSTKGGSYPIFVDYNDQNPEERDIRVFYLVHVERIANSWVQTPVLNDWTYGQTPTFDKLPIAEYNNENLQYSFRNKGASGDFQILPTENISQALNELNAGEYELNVAFNRSFVYESIEMTIDFKVERANLPQQDEEMLDAITPQAYAGGSIVFPVLTGQAIASRLIRLDYSASWQWVDVGVYQIPLEVDPNYKWKDTDDFVKYFEFEILAVENSWLDTEFALATENSVFGWVKGEFAPSKVVNLPISAYGQVSLAYRLLGDDGEFIDIEPNNLGNIDPGQYELKAYIKPSNNYSDITPIIIEFEVFAE